MRQKFHRGRDLHLMLFLLADLEMRFVKVRGEGAFTKMFDKICLLDLVAGLESSFGRAERVVVVVHARVLIHVLRVLLLTFSIHFLLLQSFLQFEV